VDRALCIAYLICRIADTIEDEISLEHDRKEALYDALLQALDRPEDKACTEYFCQSWPVLPKNEYGELILGFDLVLRAYCTIPDNMRIKVHTCVHDMVSGMRAMRPVETCNGIDFMCSNLEDLDHYCHHVAGNVGIMATEIFVTRFNPAIFVATDQWREEGRRMGLGLQMTNIIKDCHTDAARGISYIPASYVDFTQSSYALQASGRAELVNHTIEYLDHAIQYVQAVPADETGIRTFLLGSILPAIATLELAADGMDKNPKIDHSKMEEIFLCIERDDGRNGVHAAWYAEHRQRTLDKL
jgi:farnesyl-diphosphate farnesyltransferase